MPSPQYYIGLMSGTSIDGIDAALVEFTPKPSLQTFSYIPFSDLLRETIANISRPNHAIQLSDYGKLDAQLGHLFADAVLALLETTAIKAHQIKAIGSHGQTIYHSPDSHYGFSLQIGDPNIIAQKTGITTVADFRRRDIAEGGQGAPLVPAFHHAIFHSNQENRVIVNIGGIANISILPKNKHHPIIGFDTGTGNTLMDAWIKRHKNKDYDKNGDWAKSGTPIKALTQQLLNDTYFKKAAPKSTGKEYFSITWLEQYLQNFKQTKSDSHLAELMFQYGRYLLIASSRQGTLPANLQEIGRAHV